MKNNKYLTAAVALATVASLGIGFSAFAQSSPSPAAGFTMSMHGGMMGHGRMGGAMIVGTVSSVSGNTITLSGHAGFGGRPGSTSTSAPASTTYTIDATNAKITKSGAALTISGIATGDTLMVRGTVSGASVTATTITDGLPQRNGVSGKVTAVSGSTLTVAGRNSTSYTVDASAATVTKSKAASSVSAIAVGDTVFVQGTVNGTSVTATTIEDGVGAQWPGSNGGAKIPGSGGATIAGNGEPVVAGSVTAISGSTITITNKSNVTYTIDASATTYSNVKVGDGIVVQGTVNGNSVVASSVIDNAANASAAGGAKPAHKGILNGIGSFFSHLFGF